MAQILFTDKLKGSVLTHQDVNEIKQAVNINGQNSVTDVQNIGDNPAGHGVFSDKPDGNTVNLKSIAPFTGITVGSTDSNVVISITDTGVTSGEYTFPKFTVNNQGQLTVAESNRQDILNLFSVQTVAANADGFLTYDSAGTFRFSPPATRSRVSVAESSGLTYDVDTGVFGTFQIPNSQLRHSNITINNYSTPLGGSVTLVTDDVAESKGTDGNSNAINQWFTQARARSSISLNNLAAASNGSLSYNNSTGVLTHRAPSDSWARGLFSVAAADTSGDGAGLTYNNNSGVFTLTATTAEIAEDPEATVDSGTMYFTRARARGSVSAGNGLTYDSSTGVFTTKSTDSVQYQTITANQKLVTNTIQAKTTNDDVTIDDSVIITGDLTVRGTTTSELSETVEIKDNILLLNSNVPNTAEPTQNAGISVNRGRRKKVFFVWDEIEDRWSTNGDELQASKFVGPLQGNVTGNVTGAVNGTVTSLSNHDTSTLQEDADATVDSGTMYFTQSRARATVSVSDLGGDGSLSYDNTSGVFTYTGPSAAETRAHFAAGTGLKYDSGTFTLTATTTQVSEGDNLYYKDSRARASISTSTATTPSGGGSLSYNNSTGVLSYTPADVGGGAQAALSVSDLGGDGSLSYDNTSGVFTYTGPSAAETRAHFAAGSGIKYDNGTFTLTATTDTLTEGTVNLFHTQARAKQALGYTGTDLDTQLSTINTSIANKAPVTHGHTIAEVAGLQDSLDGKAEDDHSHSIPELDDVLVNNLQDGQTLVYNSALGIWKNEDVTTTTTSTTAITADTIVAEEHLVVPRLSTTQRNNITTPVDGEIIYNNTTGKFQGRESSSWVDLNGSTGGANTRTTSSSSTSVIAHGASDDITVSAAKSYMLQKIETSAAAWVTLYTDTATRSADASRSQSTDPLPGSGVIAEVITSGATSQLITPGVMGFNNDTVPSTNVYLKVENQSGSNAAITVTLTYLKLED